MQNKEKLLEECICYMRARPVFARVLGQLQKKAVSLGHVGGTVVICGWTEQEREHLEGFFQKNLHGQKQLTISPALLERSLADSRFAGLSWEEILEAYFGTPLVGKKEQKRKEESERDAFFAQYADEKGKPGEQFLAKLLSGACEGRSLLYRQYRNDREKLGKRLSVFLRACACLPKEQGCVRTLPVFAAEISGDPHYFDEGSAAVQLLRLFIQEHYGLKRQISYSDTEWKARILYRAGILKDDLSNTVLTYGLQGFLHDGSRHAGLEGFYQMREPLQCTLQTLYHLERICGGTDVYIVENPAVFAALVSRYPEKAFVCTSGQLRLSGLILLDLLSKEGRLHYSGDYDPEGLGIAQRLKDRYGSQLELWEYEPEYYLRATPVETLPEEDMTLERMKKLEKIKDEKLVVIADLIRQHKKAVYQENMLSWAYQIGASI